MSIDKRLTIIVWFAALAAITTGCSHHAASQAGQMPAQTPAIRQAMRRDMFKPDTSTPPPPQSGGPGSH